MTLLPFSLNMAMTRKSTNWNLSLGFFACRRNGGSLALVTLGDIYVTGAYGVRVNVKDAKKLYREAAEMGYKMAETRLAQLSGK